MHLTGKARAALAALAVGLAAASCAKLHDRDSATTSQPPVGPQEGVAAGKAADSPASFRIATMPAATEQPAPIDHLGRDKMRDALRRGELTIQLADGTSYPVRIDREQVEMGGRSSFIGRVKTRFGVQSAVLTFGPDAVFGVLPMPDGRKLSVSTTNGVVGIALAGGIIPPGMEDAPDTDYVVPGAERRTPRQGMQPAALANDRSSRRHLVQPSPAGLESHAAYVDAGEGSDVRIDLLGLYGDDLVEFRGGVSAAETEVISQVAITNQAHIDSGSRVRFSLVEMRHIAIPAGRFNSDVLVDTYQNQIDGLDVASLRDKVGADLVFVLRPYLDGDWSCGVGFLIGSQQKRTGNMDEEYGYSVSNVGLCGPYTLAHELGHNMGAMHDRVTDSPLGVGGFGAYPYSFGYRMCLDYLADGVDGFATIMSYRSNNGCYNEWLGYFSNPLLATCYGRACGETGKADNVRGFNRSATATAAFRGEPGTLSIADSDAVEPRIGKTAWISVPVRLSGIAPAGGLAVEVEIVGGTATAGLDYEAMPTSRLSIAAGERNAFLVIGVLPDDVDEGDETILLRIRGIGNSSVDDAEGVVTIADDDPRPILRGALRFPAGSTPPATVAVTVLGGDGAFDTYDIEISAPDYRYAIPVVIGSGVRLDAQVPAPFAPRPLIVGQVLTDVQQDYEIPLGVELSGRLLLPQGGPVPAELVQGQVTQLDPAEMGINAKSVELVLAPNETFRYLVTPGSEVRIWMTPAWPYLPYYKVITSVIADQASDIVLSTLPSLTLRSPQLPKPEGHAGDPYDPAIVIELSAPAPAGGVSFTYRTASGTAIAGQDFKPVFESLHIEAGQTRDTVWVTGIGDDIAEEDEYFYLIVDDVVGAVPTMSSIPVMILDDDSPPSLPSLSLATIGTKTEGPAGSRQTARLRLALSSPAPEGGVSLYYHTVSATAKARQDYVPVSRLLTFAEGEIATEIEVEILGDDLVEEDEYFYFECTNVQGATPASTRLPITIPNDDTRVPVLSLKGASPSIEGPAGTHATIDVAIELSAPAPDAGVTLFYHSVSGTAKAREDYAPASGTMAFTPGEARKTFQVEILGDDRVENDEYFDLEVAHVQGAIVPAPRLRIHVPNDD